MNMIRMIALGTVMAFGAGQAWAEAQHLRFATGQSPDSVIEKKSYGPWAEALNEESKGALDVVAYPPPFATTTNMWDRVTAGVADIGVVALNNSGLPLKAAFVASLPGLGRDTEAASVAMWRLYEQGLLDAAFDEVEVLGFQTAIAFTLYSKTPITKMEDLKGLRVRVADANSAAALGALGASPASIPFNEAYQAIDRGVVDAAVGNGNTMVVFRFRELLNHEQTSVAFGMTNFAFVMNKDAYANLSPEGRATIDGWRGERLSRYLGAHQNGFMEDFNSEMLAAGDLTQSELEPAELVRWQEAIAPVTAKWIADTPDGQKIYDTFVAEYDKVVAAKN